MSIYHAIYVIFLLLQTDRSNCFNAIINFPYRIYDTTFVTSKPVQLIIYNHSYYDVGAQADDLLSILHLRPLEKLTFTFAKHSRMTKTKTEDKLKTCNGNDGLKKILNSLRPTKAIFNSSTFYASRSECQ